MRTLLKLLALVMGMTMVASAADVTLVWDPPPVQAGVTITAYNLFRTTVKGGEKPPALTGVHPAPGTRPTYTDLNVPPGTYYYTLTAYCGGCGTGGTESVMSAESAPVVVPAAVIIVLPPPAPTAQVVTH